MSDTLPKIERALELGRYEEAAKLAREHVRGLPPGRLGELSALTLKFTNLQREGKLHEDFVSVVVESFNEYRLSLNTAPAYEPPVVLPCPMCSHVHLARRCPCGCEGLSGF